MIMPVKDSQRSFWPIAIIGFFAVAIISIAVLITWAVRQNMDLVRPDYYAEEIRFQKQLDRMNRAQMLNTEATIAYDTVRQSITVTIPASQSPRQTTGFIHFYRPSDATLDKNIKLSLTTDGTQRIDVKQLNAGLWKVRLYWKVNGEEFYCDRSIVIGA